MSYLFCCTFCSWSISSLASSIVCEYLIDVFRLGNPTGSLFVTFDIHTQDTFELLDIGLDSETAGDVIR